MSETTKSAVRAVCTAWAVCWGLVSEADVKPPAIIGDHMVLQREVAVPVWGWADPGEAVSVSIAGQTHAATADAEGNWRVQLEPLATGDPLTMTVAGNTTVEVTDILVGEVWVCSGQSNMQMSVSSCWNSDIESAAADYPGIRLVTVGTPGTQTPLKDFPGTWEPCTPATVRGFSGTGYFFGRTLHQVTGVPIGLIDNAWGGSACEAWVRRDLLEGKELYAALLERWATTEATWTAEKAEADYDKKLAEWEARRDEAKTAGRPVPRKPRKPGNPLTGQHRPANLYNGRLAPIMPYAIRGVVWYQGESNAGRAYQYRDLFPLMIRNWRDAWGQGDFPFYWVQVADFMSEKPDPVESAWAELREAQTMAMARLPNTGEAVIIDVGEASDIHPKNKQEVGVRLARWALANQYGVSIPFRSPQFLSAEPAAERMTVSFEHVGAGLRTVDRRKVLGFAITGEDRVWTWAEAKIVAKDRVEVWNPDVAAPVAVRYAWADNPVCNLYTKEGLPVTPFRSDDWPGVTAEKR